MRDADLKASDFDAPSSYLKAADLDGEEVTLTITGIEKVEFDQEDMKTGRQYKQAKPVISFEETDKSLVCNKTNRGAIAYVYGDLVRDWIGKKITLFPSTVPVGNDIKPCIRVRVLKEGGGKPKFLTKGKHDELNPPPPMDDEIPF